MQAQDQFKPGIGVNILSLFKLKRQNFSECRKMLCKAYIEFVNCTARVERVGEMVIDRLAIRGFRSILVSWRCHWPIGLWLLAGRDIYAQSGMGNILENVLLETMYDLPSDKRISHVQITRESVLGEDSPIIKRKRA